MGAPGAGTRAVEGLDVGGAGAEPETVGAWVVSSLGWVIPAPGLARRVILTVSFLRGTVEVFAVGLGGLGASSLIDTGNVDAGGLLPTVHPINLDSLPAVNAYRV